MRGRADKPISQCPIGVPYGVLKFAPKKERRDGVPTEQCGGPIVEMLRSEPKIESIRSKRRSSASRTRSWLKKVVEKLVKPATAPRSKIDDLGS